MANVDQNNQNEVELYDAIVTIRSKMSVAWDIRDKLIIGTPRYALFRETCFGPWLDVQFTEKDPSLVHLILQTEYIPQHPKNDEMLFRIGGHELRFGREEFCLVTGLRFGPLRISSEKCFEIPFRARVFPHIPGRVSIKGCDVANIFNDSFDQISDLDAVRVSLLMLLAIGFLGRDSKWVVDDELLQLVEDLDSWNAFPWGSYIWDLTYAQLTGVLQTRKGMHLSRLSTKQPKYSLCGFIWAFKIWIFEVFPCTRQFARRDPGVIPRAVAWHKTCALKKEMFNEFLVPRQGDEPLHELIPTLAESSSPWWTASRRFFDGVIDDIQPPPKKARLTSPPRPSPHERTLEERIMDRMSGMIDQRLSKLDNRVSRLEDFVEDLPKVRLAPDVHTKVPKMSCYVDEVNPRNTEVEEQASTLLTRKSHKQPFVIGVAGGAASGKTTVCNMIIEQLLDLRVVLLNQESFYHTLTSKELSEVHEYNFDHPDAFETEKLLVAMELLKHGKAIDIPQYDFKSYKIGVAQRVNPSDVIILAGMFIFHDPRVRDMMDLKIFVDTDADVCLERIIRRDTGERGRDFDTVFGQYSKFVKPAFDAFIHPTKKYADIIIPRVGDNQLAIDSVVQHIRSKLGQHDLCKIYPNLYLVHSTSQIRGMHTLIRDFQTTKPDFNFYADRLIRLVVEHGLRHLPFTEKQVTTPSGSRYTGVEFYERVCGVSIIRSGEGMERALQACCKDVKIGKILIHREGENGQQFIYEKLPQDISDRHVFLLDPILGTGNLAVEAISLLLDKGVLEGNIIFLNLISAPQGVHMVCKKFPNLKIVTSEIETGLSQDSWVVPGMGEFGDRYFGTDF